MTFRSRLAMLKNIPGGVFILKHFGPNLTAANLIRTLPVIYNCSQFSSVASSSNNAHVCNKGNASQMQLICPNQKLNTGLHFVSNAGKYQNHISMRTFGVFTTHFANLSHRISTFSVLRRTVTTFVPIHSRSFAIQLAVNDIGIKCFRTKHTLPKVPPTRMMSVYDLERTITDEEAAKEFVYALKPGERKFLYEELARFHGDTSAVSNLGSEPPTRQQLKLVTLHQMFPFIGFGFLDNCLMIVALFEDIWTSYGLEIWQECSFHRWEEGEYIDLMLGVTLGISTMAGVFYDKNQTDNEVQEQLGAAALGNWFSDVCGLGSAHYVENFVARFGIRHPHLSPAQVDMKSTKWASNFGKVIGVTIGCFLGMFPLLFFKNEKTKEEKDKEKKEALQAKQ